MAAITQTAPAQLDVLIADDHPLMVASLRRAIERAGDLRVAGEAHSGDELIALVGRSTPDLVVMDLLMPGGNGIDVLRRIRDRWPRIGIVVISAYDERSTVDAALAAGAAAYVVKSARIIDIAAVLRRVAAGVVHREPLGAPPAA